MALLRPTLDQLDQLIRPLNEAELATAEALAGLSDDWTVYIQPRVALESPDFIVVHDLMGVCVIEVRDWTPDTEHAPHDDPRFAASRTRAVVYDQFFALPSDSAEPTATVRATVILPRCTDEQAAALIGPADGDDRAVEIWGSDSLTNDLERIVKGTGCAHPRLDSVTRVRNQIVSSVLPTHPVVVAPRSNGASEVEINKLGTKIRRIRGAAGSGKSFGLTARAAHLAAQGKRVLVLSFNVTLADHLRQLVSDRCAEYNTNPTLVACTNFHSVCTRIVQDAERAGVEVCPPDGASWTTAIVKKAIAVLEAGNVPRYDAILVDEGQDFELAWWQLLRTHLLAEDGEMLFAVDPTQDLYGRTAWHIEDTMISAGFQEPWIEMTDSYRMPSDLVPAASRFAIDVVGSRSIAPTTPGDLFEMSGPSHGSLRLWKSVDKVGDTGISVGREVVRLLQKYPIINPSEVAFICEYHYDGVAAAREIEAAGYPVHHVFSRDPNDGRRRRNYRFSPNADGVKGCTIHSFKGWQASVVVLGIGLETKSKRTAYIAMTRLQSHPSRPAVVSVVSADNRLNEFGSSFMGIPDTSAQSAAPAPAPARAPEVAAAPTPPTTAELTPPAHPATTPTTTPNEPAAPAAGSTPLAPPTAPTAGPVGSPFDAPAPTTGPNGATPSASFAAPKAASAPAPAPLATPSAPASQPLAAPTASATPQDDSDQATGAIALAAPTIAPDGDSEQDAVDFAELTEAIELTDSEEASELAEVTAVLPLPSRPLTDPAPQAPPAPATPVPADLAPPSFDAPRAEVPEAASDVIPDDARELTDEPTAPATDDIVPELTDDVVPDDVVPEVTDEPTAEFGPPAPADATMPAPTLDVDALDDGADDAADDGADDKAPAPAALALPTAAPTPMPAPAAPTLAALPPIPATPSESAPAANLVVPAAPAAFAAPAMPDTLAEPDTLAAPILAEPAAAPTPAPAAVPARRSDFTTSPAGTSGMPVPPPPGCAPLAHPSLHPNVRPAGQPSIRFDSPAPAASNASLSGAWSVPATRAAVPAPAPGASAPTASAPLTPPSIG